MARQLLTMTLDEKLISNYQWDIVENITLDIFYLFRIVFLFINSLYEYSKVFRNASLTQYNKTRVYNFSKVHIVQICYKMFHFYGHFHRLNTFFAFFVDVTNLQVVKTNWHFVVVNEQIYSTCCWTPNSTFFKLRIKYPYIIYFLSICTS